MLPEFSKQELINFYNLLYKIFKKGNNVNCNPDKNLECDPDIKVFVENVIWSEDGI